ncbi:hypothetical protein acsn021_06390 [Anaerocolumna cellulosilytica]|uniref:Uncharacterized protein n=1 Tax=Anaerocolumna cellulosilytica TaxID=433286 RepID=A0A6S6R187_9FIRM|nr:hypothetical protein [Anaerocolumna cellulosilytica]MBB5198093.1 hypothetical protein [Anaerocolumna cellulosilytica]BCJ93070.1 hypothetical protein acsn021_06390 [Anaerocolumna cellulosilytica]
MKRLDNVLIMTFEEMNTLYEIADTAECKAGDWYPTLDDLNHIVKYDPATYVDFLIWIYETANFPSSKEAQSIKIEINNIIKNTIQIIE